MSMVKIKDTPANLNVLTTVLSARPGEVDATNARQNTIAANQNAVAINALKSARAV